MHRLVPHLEFWNRFVASAKIADANDRLLEPMRIGDSDESAAEGAALILSGVKTATSSLKLAHDLEGTPIPRHGALSILENGAHEPVAVLETMDVVIEKFAEIDDAFARAYGEWGGSLKSWRRQCRAYYGPRCRALGQPFSESTELVCEWFRVVFIPEERAVPQVRRGRRGPSPDGDRMV